MSPRPSSADRPLSLVPPATRDAALFAARDAMSRGAWADARSHLQKALAAGESPELLEDLGLAGWWLDDARLVFDARERAYALYRESDDSRGAARVAIWLTWDNLAFRGDFAVASGWLGRARRLLDHHHITPEYGWLLLREGEVALFRGHDPARAIELAQSAISLARAVNDQSIEFTALALEGLARVSMGEVVSGLQRLDEASVAATAGEMKELHAVGVVCCWQIFACERLRDYERAAQWCARVSEFTRRWGLQPLSAVCRAQYAGVLIWRGEWDKAEEELVHSARELERSRPGMVAPAIARLGELRLRQGKLDEAERLFVQAGSNSLARIGLAALMLERGNAGESIALLDQFLSQVGDAESTTRVSALELLIRAHAVRGDASAAAHALEELQRIASDLATDPMMAATAVARAIVARLGGALADAATCLEQGITLFERAGAPFETARARLDLAEICASTGRQESARREARLASDVFASLGATRDADRAAAFVATLRAPGSNKSGPDLTGRQLEILRLVAQGLSNGEIASRLGLSEHTVKRHVANLLLKLALPSRAAAVAFAARRGLI